LKSFVQRSGRGHLQVAVLPPFSIQQIEMTAINGTDVIKRNNVQIKSTGRQTMIFAHGFGCDHNMWCHVAPAFEDEYRVVLFDNVGAGDLTFRSSTKKNMGRYTDMLGT
jgi:pimeloyl-ACP methyl ester carboxylesterase